MNKQRDLDLFRDKLGLDQWTISENVKAPFAESLRQYCKKNGYEFHVEIDYTDNFATLYMTCDRDIVTVSGYVDQQSLSQPDKLDMLEDSAAQKLIRKN